MFGGDLGFGCRWLPALGAAGLACGIAAFLGRVRLGLRLFGREKNVAMVKVFPRAGTRVKRPRGPKGFEKLKGRCLHATPKRANGIIGSADNRILYAALSFRRSSPSRISL